MNRGTERNNIYARCVRAASIVACCLSALIAVSLISATVHAETVQPEEKTAAPFAVTTGAPGTGIDQNFFAPGGVLDEVNGRSASSDGDKSAAYPAATPALDPGTAAVKVFGALFLVVCLIVGIFKLGRRAKLPFFGSEGIVRRIATEPLGPNQFINVVEIGGRVIVLGTSEKSITMITELSGDALDQFRLVHSAQKSIQHGGMRDGFSSILKSMHAMIGGADEQLTPGTSVARTLEKERDRLKGMAL